MDGFNIDPSVLGNVVNAASLPLAPVNAIDPDLDVASQWRTSLSVNYDADLGFLGDGWLFGADILYSDIIDAYQWTDLRSVVDRNSARRPRLATMCVQAESGPAATRTC